MTSRTSEQSPRFGESLERPLVRREDQIVGPLFSLGVSLTGTFLGEDSCLQRRMGSDDDLRSGTLPLGRSVNERGYWTACPDSGSGLVLALSRFKRHGLRISCLEWSEGGKATLRQFSSRCEFRVERIKCSWAFSWLVMGSVTVDGNV